MWASEPIGALFRASSAVQPFAPRLQDAGYACPSVQDAIDLLGVSIGRDAEFVDFPWVFRSSRAGTRSAKDDRRGNQASCDPEPEVSVAGIWPVVILAWTAWFSDSRCKGRETKVQGHREKDLLAVLPCASHTTTRPRANLHPPTLDSLHLLSPRPPCMKILVLAPTKSEVEAASAHHASVGCLLGQVQARLVLNSHRTVLFCRRSVSSLFH